MCEKENFMLELGGQVRLGETKEKYEMVLVRGNLQILRGRNEHGIFKGQFGNWPGDSRYFISANPGKVDHTQNINKIQLNIYHKTEH